MPEGIQESRSPNAVVNAVIDSLPTPTKRAKDSYQLLNAPTIEEADKKFIDQLKIKLKKDGLGQYVDEGVNLTVSLLSGDENVVVKRLVDIEDNTKEENDQRWADLKKEHEMVEKYFGRRFVPYTEFLEIEDGFGDSSGKQYIMVQEKVYGREYFENRSFPTPSPKLKGEMIEFIKRYEKMMHETYTTIPDQFMIDFEREEIKIFDTNLLTSLQANLKNSSSELLQNFAIDPESIQLQDVIDILTTRYPMLAGLHGQDYKTIRDAFDDREKRLEQKVNETLKDMYERDLFSDLVQALTYFAPSGYHNPLIESMITKFEISEADLSESGKKSI